MIKIVKEAVGGDETFGFTVTGQSGSTPSVTTVGGNGDTGLISVNTGDYGVAETSTPEGWDLTEAVCDSGEPDDFSVAEGETVTCTFTNVKRAQIEVTKTTVGGEGSFDFTGLDEAGIGSEHAFTLDTTGQPDLTASSFFDVFVGIDGADVEVEEAPKDGWEQSGFVCGTPLAMSAPVNGILNVQPGDNLQCVFTNTLLPTLTVIKTVSNNYGGTKQASHFFF